MEEQNNNQEQLNETEAVSETVEEVLETVPAAEEIPAEETPAEEVTAQETPAEPAKKATPGKIAVAVGIVILLASLLIALIVSGQNGKQEVPDAETAEVVETVEATIPADGNPDDVTCKGSYSVSDEEAIAQGDVVVATMGEHQLTNSRLQVYYWMEIQNFLNQYGAYAAYFGLDYTKPLDTQLEEEGLTWQQYFLDTALNNWHQVQSMSLMAQETGLPITEVNKTYLEGLDDYLEQTAAANGVSVEELMMGNFGPGADKEDYRYFQELYLTGVPYYQAAVEAMKPTQEELEAYFAEHEEKYAESGVTKDSKFVDVRHILVKVADTAAEEDWKTCEEKAQAILDEWLAGDKTEESFAALAAEKTEDPGSKQNGGLYQQVYQGQMVPEFNDWCFDEARTYGDYDLVKTSYGYHVMFFVKSEPSWISYAESDWMNEQSADLLAAVTSLYPMEVSYDKIALGVVELG